MLLKKYMSLLGFGSARVDLKLEKFEVRAGECMVGSYTINGGTIEQRLKRIECDLVKTNKINDTVEVVDSTTILTTKLINSECISKIPFTFYIPPHLEASSNQWSYRFKTRMVFQEGMKSMDQDIITVLPAL